MEDQAKDVDLEEVEKAMQEYCKKKGFAGFAFILSMAKQDGYVSTLAGIRNINPLFLLQGMIPNIVKALSNLVEVAQKAMTKPPDGRMYT